MKEMRRVIVGATISALRSVTNTRFFRTERGYQGRFFCGLQEALDSSDSILDAVCILEMEYQKRGERHHTRQRPDIILHIPAEESGAPVSENNLAVWALKRRASQAEAIQDFDKLDVMFSELCCPLGFFVNIDSNSHHLHCYAGDYPERLVAFAVRLGNGDIAVKQAWREEGEVVEIDL